MDFYLKIWRYRNGVLQYRSRTNPDQDLQIVYSGLADWQFTALKENDWVIQRLPASARGQITKRIEPREITAIIPDSRVPASADIWYWSGERLKRLYRRSGTARSASEADDFPVVSAMCEGKDPLVILYCGPEAVNFIYNPAENSWETSELAKITCNLTRGQQATAAIFDEDDVLLATLLKRLSKVRNKLQALDRDRKDQERRKGLSRLAAEVAVEVLEGAEPAPVQGPNVLHGMPSLIENLDKVISVCNGRQNLAQVNEANDQTFSAAWGNNVSSGAQGVGLVDGAWQACGTLLALVHSCIDMKAILEEDAETRQAKHGANARTRQVITIASHATKGVQTGASISDAIINVTSAAAKVPGTIVPIAGVITGAVTTVRSSVQAEKSRRRANRLRNVLNRKGGALPDDVGAYLGYAMQKASRKFKFKTAEATVAAGGTVSSGVLLVGACVAGANAWNPVGWGIGAVVVVAGSGLLAYKLYRHKTSKRRARKRGFTRQQFPGLVIERFVEAFEREPNGITTETMAALLEAYGCDPLSIIMGGDKEVELAAARIARHLR